MTPPASAAPARGLKTVPLVSVVIPTFNCAEWIGETIDSVLRSYFQSYEIIVVDDGSTDKTADVVKKLMRRSHRIKYLKRENRGPSAARNFGIKQSRGEFILPLDADDLIAPSYIGKAVAVLERERAVSIVYCFAEKFGEESGRWELPEFTMPHMLLSNCIFCTAMFRRADFNRTGGYCEELRGWEDWDFWLSLLELGGSVHCLEEILFSYRIRSNSRTFTSNRVDPRSILQSIVARHEKLYAKHLTDLVDYAGLLHVRQQNGSQKLARAMSETASKLRRIVRRD
jgi:glycosyltransferase involved in cell wall biosynthesis